MQPTSEERREVAARLRELRHMTYCNEEVVENIKDAIGIADPVNTFREPEDVYELLAGLIDPTCSMTCKGNFTAHHDFTRWECSECGAYAFAPKKVFAPRFCPNCGAEVVEE